MSPEWPHTLGEGVVATGFLGGDRGKFIRNELTQAGIEHDFVEVAPQTRLCTTVVDRSTGTATELVEESAAVANGDWDHLLETFTALVRRANLCVFSGSLPPGGPVGFYADCTRIAQGLRCRVVLDARGEPLRQAMQIPGLIIKLNREELAATIQSPLPDDASLRAAIQKVTPPEGAMVVTLGAEGAVAFDGRTFWKISSPAVKTISAVGSGDAFAAGFAVGTVRGQAIKEACVLGAACGAANAMTPLSGHVESDRVSDLLSGVEVMA